MAVYKPSNLYPNLQEIDITQDNIFSCQVNTSGSSIKAYKTRFLSEKNESLYESSCINLTNPVKNKSFLQVSGVSNSLVTNLTNGKNYKWGIRTYDAVSGSTTQPSTVVCSGFLVGSTKYVIWTSNNEKIEQDRWIEFNNTSSNMMPILEPNDDNLVLPTGNYRERHKISWVTTDLGFNENITKIETDENFKYNYINGTNFSLYQCSDEHGYNNVFVDPNDEIELSYWIIIYNSQADATSAHTAGDNPITTTVTPRETARKIVGYSSDTGEIRVQEAFSQIPINGNAYLLFSYDASTEVYTEKTSDVSQLIGGSAITDNSFTIMTNEWSSATKQLFIQPNINIKTDATNPDEIVFDDAGQRVDIIQTKSTTLVPNKTVDITIEELDNTQWLLKYVSSSSSSVPIIPKSTYTVYTDFMDSAPDCLFYARKVPNLIMQYKNYNDNNSFENISSTAKAYRDITFYTQWNSINNVQTKYYKYVLYDEDGTIIEESPNYYNSDMTWTFRGFESSDNPLVPKKYSIKVIVVDEFGKEFSALSIFKIYYEIETGIVPLSIEQNCNLMANDITISAPVFVITTNTEDKQTVDYQDVRSTEDVLEIKKNEVLNYTQIASVDTFVPFEIPNSSSFLTQFQIVGDFIDDIPEQGEKIVFQWGKNNSNNSIDIFSLKLSSFVSYYVTSDQIIQKNPNQFMLKLYKNNDSTPLNCFNGNNYFNISTEDAYKEFKAPETISCTLQNGANFIFVDILPRNASTTLKYVLREVSIYNNITYPKGIYTYISNTDKWEADYSTDYIWVDNLSEIPDYTYDTFSVPSNCRDDNGNIVWTDTGNVWVDNQNYCTTVNKIALNRKWFIFYCVIDNTGSSEIITCNMRIDNERVV